MNKYRQLQLTHLSLSWTFSFHFVSNFLLKNFSETMASNLAGMPNNILLIIMEKTDLTSILTLRKLCRDFRNFIDDVHPTVPISKICFNLATNYVQLIYSTNDGSNIIAYKVKKSGFLVHHFIDAKRNASKLIEGMDFLEVFQKDLGLVLQVLRTSNTLEELEFSKLVLQGNRIEEYSEILDRTLETFGKFLQSRKNVTKVRKLKMEIQSENQLMSILPYLEPQTLEVIEISNPRMQNDEWFNQIPFEFSRICDLEQWKTAKTFLMKQYLVTEPLENFLHLDKTEIALQSISMEDVMNLKEKALYSPTFDCFEVSYKEFQDQSRLQIVLGQPSSMFHVQIWHLPISKPDHILTIKHNSYSSRIIFIVEQESWVNGGLFQI